MPLFAWRSTLHGIPGYVGPLAQPQHTPASISGRRHRSVLGDRVRARWARISAGALWRWRYVLLCGRGAGRLGLSLAQHLRSIIGFSFLLVAGGNTGPTHRQAMGGNPDLRLPV